MSGSSPMSVDDDSDYITLALQDADFAAFVGPKGWINFKDPDTVRALCKATLKQEYALQIHLPEDRLTPFVPVRASYVRWMQKLLDATSTSYTDAYDEDRVVTGIDVGIGASAIYALLACRMRPKWRMIGTDIDLHSLTHAAHNIALNSYEPRIKLIETTSDGPLIPLQRMQLDRADFVICNPPFYTSTKEMKDSLSGHGKSRPPSTVCTGSESEMVTDGGDLGFVLRMVKESKELGDRVQWYSAMMGKFESIEGVVTKLRELDCSNWATHYLTSSGGRTRRWAIAWSWADLRAPDELARAQWLRKELLPSPAESTIVHSSPTNAVTAVLKSLLEAMDVRWRWDAGGAAGLVLIGIDVWSRHARRMKEKKPEKYTELLQNASQQPPQLIVKITVTENEVRVRWMKGNDGVLFESLCGMLRRQLNENL